MFLELWKVLTAIAKQKVCESLTEWIMQTATTTMCGTGRIIWAKFKSFLSHIVNKHENLEHPLFNKCGHMEATSATESGFYQVNIVVLVSIKCKWFTVIWLLYKFTPMLPKISYNSGFFYLSFYFSGTTYNNSFWQF